MSEPFWVPLGGAAPAPTPPSGVSVVARDNSVVSVGAAETDLCALTVPGGVMGINSTLRLSLRGLYLWNRATGDSMRLRAYWGGALFWDSISTGSALLNQVHRWKLLLEIVNMGALNSQDISGELLADSATTTAPTVGLGAFKALDGDNAIHNRMPDGAILGVDPLRTVDTAASQVIRVTGIWNSAPAATNYWTKRSALLELI